MNKKVKVAVVMGGVSGEHKVSMDSGAGVLANLPTDKYLGIPVVIEQDGSWKVGNGNRVPMLDALAVLAREEKIDVAFLALHGPNGEDGTVQSMFHLMGIAYTGSDYYASSLAMNKPRAKDAFKCAGLRVPKGIEVVPEEALGNPAEVFARAVRELGSPVVVKPAKLGSSVGMCITGDAKDGVPAIEALGRKHLEVVIEQFVKGKEVTSPVIDDPDKGTAVALPLIEIRPKVSGWFDYDAKYKIGGSDELCPAPISNELTIECKRIGLTAHRVLGCRGMSRTDILIDSFGSCIVLETNTIPGFTRTSLLPQSAQAAGLTYSTLVDLLIREAVVRKSESALHL